MIPVLIGTALALVALGFVLYPLFREEMSAGIPHTSSHIPRGQSSTAIDALREIEFDHVTGKLSDSDYAQLKASYTQRAIVSMRVKSADASVNTVICPTCGPRSEENAAFCSECGRALVL